MNAMHSLQLAGWHCIAGDAQQWRPADGVLLHKICHCCLEGGCIDHNSWYVVNHSKPLSQSLHSSCVNAAAKALNTGMRPCLPAVGACIAVNLSDQWQRCLFFFVEIWESASQKLGLLTFKAALFKGMTCRVRDH